MMENEIVTKKIIGCAFNVYNKMGFGYLESVYEKCMMIELKKAKLTADSQKPINVFYDEQLVGDFIADILVEGEIIVELKTVRRLNIIYEAQLVNYLVATRKDIGLLINFGIQKVEVKRKVRVL